MFDWKKNRRTGQVLHRYDDIVKAVQGWPKSSYLMMNTAEGSAGGGGGGSQTREDLQWLEGGRGGRGRKREGGGNHGKAKSCVLLQVRSIPGRWAISTPPGAEIEKLKTEEVTGGNQHRNQLLRLVPLSITTNSLITVPPTTATQQEWPCGKGDSPYLAEASKPTGA